MQQCLLKFAFNHMREISHSLSCQLLCNVCKIVAMPQPHQNIENLSSGPAEVDLNFHRHQGSFTELEDLTSYPDQVDQNSYRDQSSSSEGLNLSFEPDKVDLNLHKDQSSGYECDCEGCALDQDLQPSTFEEDAPTGCHANQGHFESPRAICAASLCPKVLHAGTNLELHRMKCISGECTKCGFGQKNPLCLSNEKGVASEELLQWSCFEHVASGEGKDDQGKEKTKLPIVKKQTDKSEFLNYLGLRIPEFIQHDFIYRWEDEHF